MPSRTRRNRWQDADKSDVKLDSVVQLYLMYQEDKNHSPKTVRWYLANVPNYRAYCKLIEGTDLLEYFVETQPCPFPPTAP